MMLQAPDFWWKQSGYLSTLLKPAAAVYNRFARYPFYRHAIFADIPVLCIGNFTLGGTGKTPVVISFAQVAQQLGYRPGILSRGAGKSASKSVNKSAKGVILDPHQVDIHRDHARQVGDEPLLLSEHAPVVVSHNRYAGALMLKQMGCRIILMDDGFQSRRLYPDYSLLLVDALRGFGNQQIFPAGPLRADLDLQLAYTDGILMMGTGEKGEEATELLIAANKAPIYQASFMPKANKQVRERKFLAFAGIGNPQKFFHSIESLGGIVARQYRFPDHYFFNKKDLDWLAEEAKREKLTLATTAKDFMRFKDFDLSHEWNSLVLFDVDVCFETKEFCAMILKETFARYETRIKC